MIRKDDLPWWMITSLRTVNVPASHPVMDLAVETLMDLQDTYGFWSSDDGSDFVLHTTLEALYALKLCEKL